MMHEEMRELHRSITREIHKKHRDFFRANWDKFCAWANMTAEECHTYCTQQWAEYRKWFEEVRLQRWQRIDAILYEATKQDDKERIARARECQERLTLAMKRRAARLADDFERRGWVRCTGGKAYSFFSIPPMWNTFWVPPDFVNPVGWVFGLKQAREPTADERLLCDCALLSVLHDSTVGGADPRICAWGFRPRYAWEHFKDGEFRAGYGLDLRDDSGGHSFVRELHGHLAAMTQDGQIKRAWERVRKHLPSGTASATAPMPDSDKPTPETDTKLIYQASAAEFYNIPKSMLSKAAKRKPSEPGYLWSDTDGKRRWYRKSDLQRVSRSREKLRGS